MSDAVLDPNLEGRSADQLSIAIILNPYAVDPTQAKLPWQEERYFGAFSGGKDSCVLKDLVARAGVPCEWHYSLTTIDPPEVVQFIRREHPDVIFDKPAHSFWWYIRHNWGLPMRQARWCCKELKERSGRNRTVLAGIRAAESRNRARYGTTQACLTPGREKRFVYPILHWSDADVWNYIRRRELPYCSLYDEGFRRIGCVFCPMERDVARAQERWPRLFAGLLRAVTDNYPNQKCWQKHGSPEAVLEWWLDRDRPQPDGEEQERFAFDQFGEE